MATKLRNIRVEDALWEAAQRAAEDDDTSVSAVVIAALRGYVAKHPKEQARRRAKIREAVAAELTDAEVEKIITILRPA